MKLLKYALVMAISIQLFIACDPRGGPGQSSGPQQPGGDQVTPPPPVSGGVSVAPDVAPDDEAVITDSGVGIPAPQNKGPEIRFPYLGIHYTEPPLKDSNGEAFLMPGSIQDLEIGDDHGRRMRIVFDIFGIESIEATDTAEKQLAASAFEIGAGVEFTVLQAVFDVEVLEPPGARIEFRQPLIGAHPEVALVVA